MVLRTSMLVFASFAVLTAALGFPDTLLDPPSFGAALVATNGVAIAIGLGGLAVSGVLLAVAAGRFPHPWLGRVAGVGWAATALMTALWAFAGVPLAGAAFGLVAIVVPLVLCAWMIARRARRVLTTLGVLGLVAVAARSVVWLVNAALPPDEGLYLTSAVLTVAALVGSLLWLAWLTGRGLVALLAAVAAVAVAFVATPAPNATGVPVVPSGPASAFYLLLEAFPQVVPLPHDLAALQEDRRRSRAELPEVPPGVSREPVDADGVPAERICAPHATTGRQILYLPGGGFTSIAGNGPRMFAAEISRRTSACVLIAHYRLAPEHPYPAGRDDAVTAYRWLARWTPAASLAVMGDSAGGNLTLTAALTLRGAGDPLPASLTSVSGVADLALTGTTFRTLSDRDPLLSAPHRALVQEAYTRNGAVDVGDPLLSPLRADPSGLPPTLLMIGTQETLLGDVLALGEKLRKAHVDVDVQAWPGQVHAWNLVFEELPEASMANDRIAAHILRAWGAVR